MTDVAIDIPLGGSFSNGSISLANKHDIIELGLGRFVAYIQQESNPLGYVAIFDFPDFLNSSTVNVTRQELLFYDDVTIARMFKISDTSILLVRNNNAYVLTIGLDTITIAITELNFFTGATNAGSTGSVTTNFLGMAGWNLKENELLFLENEGSVPSSSTLALYKLQRIVFDPIEGTLTKSTVIDFTNTETPITDADPLLFRGSFQAEITEIPDGSGYHFCFSPSLTSINTAPVQVYSARLSNEGAVLETYPLPEAPFISRFSVALSENVLFYHANAGGSVKSYDGNAFTDVLALSYSSSTSTDVPQLLPIDTGHYFIRYATTLYRVLRVTTLQLLSQNNLNVNFSSGFQTKKQAIKKIDDELYIGYLPITVVTKSTPVGNKNFLRFRVYRIYQSAQ